MDPGQAQAERERQARIILGMAETEIAHKFVEAADAYHDHPAAMHLRAMNMLYESIAKRGSLMVVPSTLADALNVSGMMGVIGVAGLTPPDGAAKSAVEPVTAPAESYGAAPSAASEREVAIGEGLPS